MALSPQALLSSLSRERFTAKLKELPVYLVNKIRAKQEASVLVPLCVENGEVCLLYTLRSSNLKNHSGQVSFPGGKMDDNETVIDTALRETEEEIGLPRDNVDLWGQLPRLQGRNRDVIVTPVVGVIKNFDMKNLKRCEDEVEEIFTVPMKVLCNTDNHAHFKYKSFVMPVFLNDKHRIWGLTAYMTHMCLQCLLPENDYKTNFERKEFTMDELMPSKL